MPKEDYQMSTENKVSQCPKCLWFEDNGAGCTCCRSPKHEWTEKETTKWRKEGQGNAFNARYSLPPFDLKKHCDFKPKRCCCFCGKQEVTYIGSGFFCGACNKYQP